MVFHNLLCLKLLCRLSYLIGSGSNCVDGLHAEEKIKFFANTAHEIRTSLTLITAPIEELNKGTANAPTRKYYLHLALEQARRLSNVVTRLMDFQKLDVGKEQLSLQRVDIVKMVNLQKMMYESLAANKNVKIVLQANQASCYCSIDEMMIEKVISNLISNAIKYAYPDTQIELQINCLPNKWVFTIKDQGIGISKEGQQRLFNEFYRDTNAINSKAIGSGIGLLMAKQYVLLHVWSPSNPNGIYSASTSSGSITPYRYEDRSFIRLQDVTLSYNVPKKIISVVGLDNVNLYVTGKNLLTITKWHASYLGPPHDYLWLCTTPPALMYEELSKAYKTGANRYWLLNVGDIKPAELCIQTFMQLVCP